MFLGLRKLGNICCRHKMFLNKIRNIFVSRTQNLCPQQMLRAGANRETFVSATMCPQQCVLVCQGLKRNKKRRIYTTLSLGTALLNFGTRANNIGHGTLDFCRVKANFSARVPKNSGGPRPPQEVVPGRLKRGLEVILSPESLRSRLCHESEGSGVENELWDAKILHFSREERWPRKIRKIVAQFASHGATMP